MFSENRYPLFGIMLNVAAKKAGAAALSYRRHGAARADVRMGTLRSKPRRVAPDLFA